MGILSVIAAAIASYAFGAVWYMVLAKQWMAASGVAVTEDGKPKNQSDPIPYIVSFVCAIIVAGMMRHTFVMSGIATPIAGLVSGFGIGLFLATPWIATNYTFSDRPKMLIVIDGGYATLGCTVMGLVLGLL